MRVVDAIAEYFVKEHVDHYFGYIGGAVWGLLDALNDKPQLKGIQAKHEATAAHMADAYFRITHRIAPVIVTKGPGILNTVNAVANAMHDSSAMVVITGSGPTQYFDKGGFEEVFYHAAEDTVSIFRPIVKRAWIVVRPEHTVDILARAFKTALSGRPGPVLVQIPWDVQHSEVSLNIPPAESLRPGGRIRSDPEMVRKAAELIHNAEKPLIVVGGGVLTSGATPELLDLAESYSIPIATTLMAKGAVPETHPLSLGQIGRSGWVPAINAAREADVILAVGCRFTDWDTVNWKPGVIFSIPPTKLIHIDIDPIEIGRNYPVEVGIIGDAKATLSDMLKILKLFPKRRGPQDPWMRTVNEWKRKWNDMVSKDLLSDMVPIHPARLLHEVRKAAPSSTLFFIDIGDIIQYAQGYLTVVEPETWFINGGMMQMGWAAGAVLAGKIAKPHTPSIALVGDGAFLMNSHVLATAVEYALPAIWVILDNFGPNLERKAQMGLYGRAHPWSTFSRKDTGEFYNPDFVKLAEAYGARGERVERPEKIGQAVAQAIRSKEPYLIDVVVNREVPSYFAPGIQRGYPKSWSELAPHF